MQDFAGAISPVISLIILWHIHYGQLNFEVSLNYKNGVWLKHSLLFKRIRQHFKLEFMEKKKMRDMSYKIMVRKEVFQTCLQ